MKTSSLWGQPQSRYYSYLARIEAAEATKAPALAVIGCADGKYVLPAARKGFDVWAVGCRRHRRQRRSQGGRLG